jgi:alkanesulfonate monooxygenase
MAAEPLTIFATTPQSKDVPRGEYPAAVRDVARWSEAAGCEGVLVYTDNGLVDAWLVAQMVIEATERLAPLVALQPAYMHPYSAAKMVASLAYLYGRQVWLNLVAGGFRNDLLALGDDTPHDERYTRVVEYATIMRGLLEGERVTFAGRFYRVEDLALVPPVAEALRPGMLMSGSSPAGLEAAAAIGAIPVKYPKPPGEEAPQDGAPGLRVGIVTRPDGEEAWRVARERFPEDRRGQLTHQLAMKVSDSEWHRQLSELGRTDGEASPYWLWPFENYATFCPYLVGSYDVVAAELRRYRELGFGTFILDIPPSAEELEHTGEAFARAA